MAQHGREGFPTTPKKGIQAAHTTSTKSPSLTVNKSPARSSATTSIHRQSSFLTARDGLALASTNVDNLKMPPGLQERARPSPPSHILRPDSSLDNRQLLMPSTSSDTLQELEQRAYFLRHSIDFTDPPDAAPFHSHRFVPPSPIPRANTTCSILSISQHRTETACRVAEQQRTRSLSVRTFEERPQSRASIHSETRWGSRPGSPTVRRVRPSSALYLDYRAWLAADQQQTKHAASRETIQGSSKGHSGTSIPQNMTRMVSPSLEHFVESPFDLPPRSLPEPDPELLSAALTRESRSPPSSLPVRSPSTKGPVAPRTFRIPSDVTIRGVRVSDRSPSDHFDVASRKPSGHTSPTIASQLKAREKYSPPRSDVSSTSAAPDNTTPSRSIARSTDAVTQYAQASSGSWSPLVDFMESRKLQEKTSQTPSSSQESPSPTPTKDRLSLARKKGLRLEKGSGSSTVADSDSPLYSPVSPNTMQGAPLHEECRQVLQELQLMSEADRNCQETMKECIAEFAKCQVRKETLIKRVEDLLDRAEYFKTPASGIHGDEVQLFEEYHFDHQVD
ncbi:hypothetical protein FRC04_008878 [Tulasnella sp. 424]|nr:hypothetical protein FRC04_008878 [Tulasnella sp. 424]KAG8973778.1 hypothetical protein FRC05_008197 [Tulasnella sp. 425]